MAERTADASVESEWEQLAPLLDELVGRLSKPDRQAVLLRFYEQKSFPEIGAAVRIAEEAARKRVSRATDKLRALFSRRGVTLGAGALAGTLAANASHPASAALVLSVSSAAATTAQGGAVAGLVQSAASMLRYAAAVKTAAAIGIAVILALVSLELTLAIMQPAAPSPQPVTAGNVLPATLPVVTAPPPTPYQIRVVDPAGAPVAAAAVELITETQFGSTPTATVFQQLTSAADGVLPYSGPYAGVTALVRAPEFGITGANLIARHAGDFLIRLREPASLQLRLVDPLGNPISGVRVAPTQISEGRAAWRIWLPKELSQELSGISGPDGRCELSGLPRSSIVRLSVIADGFVAIYSASNTFALGASATNDAGEIMLERAGGITGKVTFGPERKPVAGAVVYALSSRNTLHPEHTTSVQAPDNRSPPAQAR
jgi:hypothetical protein